MVVMCVAVAGDSFRFLSLIFVPKFYFIINGKRNSNIWCHTLGAICRLTFLFHHPTPK